MADVKMGEKDMEYLTPVVMSPLNRSEQSSSQSSIEEDPVTTDCDADVESNMSDEPFSSLEKKCAEKKLDDEEGGNLSPLQTYLCCGSLVVLIFIFTLSVCLPAEEDTPTKRFHNKTSKPGIKQSVIFRDKVACTNLQYITGHHIVMLAHSITGVKTCRFCDIDLRNGKVVTTRKIFSLPLDMLCFSEKNCVFIYSNGIVYSTKSVDVNKKYCGEIKAASIIPDINNDGKQDIILSCKEDNNGNSFLKILSGEGLKEIFEIKIPKKSQIHRFLMQRETFVMLVRTGSGINAYQLNCSKVKRMFDFTLLWDDFVTQIVNDIDVEKDVLLADLDGNGFVDLVCVTISLVGDSGDKNRHIVDDSGDINQNIIDDSGDKNQNIVGDSGDKKRHVVDDSGDINQNIVDDSGDKNQHIVGISGDKQEELFRIPIRSPNHLTRISSVYLANRFHLALLYHAERSSCFLIEIVELRGQTVIYTLMLPNLPNAFVDNGHTSTMFYWEDKKKFSCKEDNPKNLSFLSTIKRPYDRYKRPHKNAQPLRIHKESVQLNVSIPGEKSVITPRPPQRLQKREYNPMYEEIGKERKIELVQKSKTRPDKNHNISKEKEEKEEKGEKEEEKPEVIHERNWKGPISFLESFITNLQMKLLNGIKMAVVLFYQNTELNKVHSNKKIIGSWERVAQKDRKDNELTQFFSRNYGILQLFGGEPSNYFKRVSNDKPHYRSRRSIIKAHMKLPFCRSLGLVAIRLSLKDNVVSMKKMKYDTQSLVDGCVQTKRKVLETLIADDVVVTRLEYYAADSGQVQGTEIRWDKLKN